MNIRLQGIVIPALWDDQGKVIGLAIHAFDEKEYFVEPDGLGRTLMTRIHKTVEVSGKVRKNREGKASLKVQAVKMLPGLWAKGEA